MLNYVWRQELAPLLSIDPVLRYYPLRACYDEMRAPVTVWQDADGAIQGALVPCNPPGRAWLIAASTEAVVALIKEMPAEMALTAPLWTDSLISQLAPNRTLSTDVIAVCTASSLQPVLPRSGVRLHPLDSPPGEALNAATVTSARVAHLGCVVGGNLAGYCTYHLDGRGTGSIERLEISEEWRGADLGKTLVSAAAKTMLEEEAERLVFAAAGENQPLLGVARAVGFRTCYWMKFASPER
ncbi:MAG: GNAT family N-acetyltransferase [Armatimonadota bacterium]|nr:GNAT family N-acetyltransferase [Armatimonadota bacterium]